MTDPVERICDLVHELEAAFVDGVLPERIASLDTTDVPYGDVVDAYRKLVDTAPGPYQRLRVDAIRTLLAQFRNVSNPAVIFGASRLDDHREDHGRPAFGNAIENIEVEVANATITLRMDQVHDAAFWGIGFVLSTMESDEKFEFQMLKRSGRRLAHSIRGLNETLRRFRTTSSIEGLKIVSTSYEKRFEHLVVDILNEEDRIATHASIEEDFLEKTDIRVKYPSLVRRNGARVQVTSIVSPELHQAKIDAIRRSEEYVFLSPLSLAEFAVGIEGTSPSSVLTTMTDPNEVWRLIDCENDAASSIAQKIREHLFSAIRSPVTSPRGPLSSVHPSIRRLIRTFVEERAFATTATIRRRRGQLLAESSDDVPQADG